LHGDAGCGRRRAQPKTNVPKSSGHYRPRPDTDDSSWPDLFRPSTPSIPTSFKTWMPATSAGMTAVKDRTLRTAPWKHGLTPSLGDQPSPWREPQLSIFRKSGRRISKENATESVKLKRFTIRRHREAIQNAERRAREFENVCALRNLAEQMRIMAAMPQFSRLRIKQRAKKDSRQIRGITVAGEIC
jgi:hypothetical protein